MARIANPDYCQNISPTPIWLPAKNNTDKRESEADMFLNYFALGVLIFVFLVIFYGIIAIHDIPYGRCEQVPDMRSCLSSGAMEQGSS